MRDGDIYMFSYNEHERTRSIGDVHWCFDGQLVYRNGRLVDTYWTGIGPRTIGAGDGRSFTPTEAESQGSLTFVANVDDLRFVSAEELRHYDEVDTFNLSTQHGCHKTFAIRASAERSLRRMTTEIDKQIQKVEREGRYAYERAVRETARLIEMKCKVSAGDASVGLWW